MVINQIIPFIIGKKRLKTNTKLSKMLENNKINDNFAKKSKNFVNCYRYTLLFSKLTSEYLPRDCLWKLIHIFNNTWVLVRSCNVFYMFLQLFGKHL